MCVALFGTLSLVSMALSNQKSSIIWTTLYLEKILKWLKNADMLHQYISVNITET